MNLERDKWLFWFGGIGALAAGLAIFQFVSDRISGAVAARLTYSPTTCPNLQPEQVDRLLDLIEGGHATPDEIESLSRTIACSMTAMHSGVPDDMASISSMLDNQVAYAAQDVELSLRILLSSDHSSIRHSAIHVIMDGFSIASISEIQKITASKGTAREKEAAHTLFTQKKNLKRWREHGDNASYLM